MRFTSLAPLASAVIASLPSAQGRLVADLNQNNSGTVSSAAKGYTSVGGDTWFAASTRAYGEELWRVDVGGTISLAADLIPGEVGSRPRALVPFGNGVLFTADTATGSSLFRVAGPGQGAVDLIPAAAGANGPSQVTVAGPNVFFLAADPTHGRELWLSRGNAGDAQLVRDILPGSASSLANGLAAVGSHLVFLADDGQHGYEWWASDGTALGTNMLADLNPGPGSGASTPVTPAAVGALAYLAADDGASGSELWVADLTAGSLRQVRDIFPGSGGSFPGQFAALPNGTVVFGATGDVSQGNELWVTDGTASGTRPVGDLYPGPAPTQPSRITPAAGGVFFLGYHPNIGLELGFSDLTAAGTRFVDLTPGTSGSNFGGLEVVAGGSTVIFHLRAASSSPEARLVISDATVQGTRELQASALDYGLGLRPSGEVMFAAMTAAEGVEPWITDGTVANTRLFVDLEPIPATDDSRPVPLGDFAGRFVFTAETGAGRDLFVISHAGGSVRRLLAGAGFRSVVARLPRGLLLAGSADMICTDGTPAGTRLLPGRPSSLGRYDGTAATVDGEVAIFNNSGELWRTDGTVAGTRQIVADGGIDFVAGDGVVYFGRAENGSSTLNAIWQTDGTAAGTVRFLQVGTPSFTNLDLVAVVGGRLVFGALASSTWGFHASDGTPSGTHLLVTQTSIPELRAPPVVLGDRVVFASWRQIYGSDGTPSGTAILLQQSTGSGFVGRAGDRAILAGRVNGVQRLFGSDGSVAGTVALPLPVGASDSVNNMPAATESRVVIGRSGFIEGLVVTDGTTANTGLVAPRVPYTAVATADGRLYYAADDVYTGIELYEFDMGAATHAEGEGCGAAAPPPRLTAGEPTIGQILRLEVRNRAGGIAAVMLGAPAGSPVLLPGPGCTLWVDLLQPTALLGTTSGGTLALPLPPGAGLVGARVGAQAFVAPSAAPLGVDVSNGLRLVLQP